MSEESTFRVAIVQQQDVTGARVRVAFPDHDQMQSYWLPIIFPKTQNDKAYWIPDIGEQVVCLMDEHDEAGAVAGAIYSSADTPPAGMTADKWHVAFKDGASFEYDRAAHALVIALPSGATLSIAAGGAAISIDASGNVNITPGSSGKIVLAGGGPALARVGDTVHVTDPDDGLLTGTIVSGSSRAVCG